MHVSVYIRAWMGKPHASMLRGLQLIILAQQDDLQVLPCFDRLLDGS